MQSLFLLILLMGGFSLFTCALYEYTFKSSRKTWHEAQDICKKHHTDLATVYDKTDTKRLNVQRESWIGLSRETVTNRKWHWSLPGVEVNQTKSYPSDEHCMVIAKNKSQTAKRCTEPRTFFCYNETRSAIIHIPVKKDWYGAQKYCREKHTDLVSGEDQLNNITFEDNPNYIWFWIGLFSDLLQWSDGSSFSFRNWNVRCGDLTDGRKCASIKASGEWICTKCDDSKPFFCYDDKLILVKENKTWQEALDYCRDYHKDMVSITSLHDQRWVQKKAKDATTEYIWLGLRYTCTLGFWFWVTGEDLTYENWGLDSEDWCRSAAAMKIGDGHQWFHVPDERRLNFICV